MKSFYIAIFAAIFTACGANEPSDEQDVTSVPSAVETAPVVSKASASEVAAGVADASEKTDTQTASADIEKTEINFLKNPNGVTELKWDDLMPIGEDEVLAELYESYYSNLRQDIERRSQLLQNPNGNAQSDAGFDVSTLISEGAANDTMEQIGTFNVVEDLNGLDVRIPGYVVPLDFKADGIYKEFLLVPYFGACLHTPPPPPNQIVFVKSETGAKVESIYDPVWVEGIMQTGRFESDTGDSAYELSLSKIEKYEY